ncbi:hypothetical protein RJ640_015732 [Escallonia rubra]|uniref:DUF4283 domain-containing protein n=1 Tax=Escallonia rubra TaxID=112253 RepID=A0AA88UU29_9ASTE|nr:hypothetical protein RJ640_015732 [Escallonia rubra]
MKVTAAKEVKAWFEERFKTGNNRWFFSKLRPKCLRCFGIVFHLLMQRGKLQVMNPVTMTNLSQPNRSHTPAIDLTTTIKARIRQPWKKTLIIKTIGAFFSATAIAPRLNGIWRPTGKLEVIHMANGFHIIKFHQENDYHKALEQGPWFIGTHFLSVHRWSHNFDPHTQKIATLAVWVRLNGLHMEYFDREILTLIGKKIGVPLRIDAITTSITKGGLLAFASKSIPIILISNKFKLGNTFKNSNIKIYLLYVTPLNASDTSAKDARLATNHKQGALLLWNPTTNNGESKIRKLLLRTILTCLKIDPGL